MDKIRLRRTSRVKAGHNWIFANELADSPKKYRPGSLVEAYDTKDNFLGIGYINPHSLISVRLLARRKQAIDKTFFRERIAAALDYRKAVGVKDDSFRAIFSESDFLPGLIADKYGACLALQILTFGMEELKEIFISELDEIFSPSSIILKNDSAIRSLEGLPLYKEVIKGSIDKPAIITEGGLSFEIHPLTGQKTGFFLDQRENRLTFAELIKEGQGLDLFCYTGAWGLHLAKKKLKVTFVDDSENAIAQAQVNAEINGIKNYCSFLKSDVFEFLRNESASGKKYDFIILDPPAFVKNRAKIKEALRGYREINSLAMSLLKSGGMLATSSCSHHIDRLSFLDMLRDAAKDAQRQFKLIEYRSQAKDHPVLLSMPETEYLKCAYLRVV